MLNDALLDLKTPPGWLYHQEKLSRGPAEARERRAGAQQPAPPIFLLEAEQNERTRARLAAETESLRNQTKAEEEKKPRA